MDTPTAPLSPQLQPKENSPPPQSAQKQQSWWEKTWVIVLACIFFAPAGIALIWTSNKRWSNTTKKVATAITAIWLFLFVFGAEDEKQPSSQVALSKREQSNIIEIETSAEKGNTQTTTAPTTGPTTITSHSTSSTSESSTTFSPSMTTTTAPTTTTPTTTTTTTTAPTTTTTTTAPTTTTTTTAPTTTTTTTTPTSEYAYYKDCEAVKKAGKAPLHRGDPGYRSRLDRDNDGIACEI